MSFFFIATATTEIYTLSLHDALPILNLSAFVARLSSTRLSAAGKPTRECVSGGTKRSASPFSSATGCRMSRTDRSEEHTSELQSRLHLVCRLLLEKKKRIVGVTNSGQ